MSVRLYNQFNIDRIRFNDVVKKKKQSIHSSDNNQTQLTIHSIDMHHNNTPIFLQLDKCVCKGVDANNCLILEVPKGVEDFIKGLEEYIIDTVYDKSEKWFNGRRFTMGKIQTALTSCLSAGQLVVTMSDNTCFFNQFRKKLTVDDLRDSWEKSSIECICVVRLCCLQFLGNKFTYKISLEQCKVNIDYKLVEYSIIDDSRDSITPITETESEKSYREYPEYYKSEVDSEGEAFFK